MAEPAGIGFCLGHVSDTAISSFMSCIPRTVILPFSKGTPSNSAMVSK